MPKKKLVALVSSQGTACAETVLVAEEDTAENRRRIEALYCRGGTDDPQPGTWCDVTDNDALRTMFDMED